MKALIISLSLLFATPALLFGQSVSELKQLSEEGNAEAQYNLAILYYKGEGVEMDKRQALLCFENAADS